MDRESRPGAPRKVRKQRIPKACSECRRSKLRCDAQRPCSRCRISNKICHYVEPSNDKDIIKALQDEVESLKRRIREPSRSLEQPINTTNQGPAQISPLATVPTLSDQDDASLYQSFFQSVLPSIAPFDHLDWTTPNLFTGPLGESSIERYLSLPSHSSPWPISEQNHTMPLEKTNNMLLLDFVTAGILTEEQAETYIVVFFRGCGRHFPFADPIHDSMPRIRVRSTLLFNTMCAVGCRARQRHQPHLWKILDVHISRMLDMHTITGTATIETIQALVIRACYSSERSLLISMATRMAFEIGLPGAYDDLKQHLTLEPAQTGPSEVLECDILLQKLRTWLSILNQRLMLGIDAGTSLDLALYGNVRRCRVLLDKPFSTDLDLCILEQIELNILMAKIYNSINDITRNTGDEGLIAVIQDSKVDIQVWFNDWAYILNSHPHEHWLRVNIKVHRHWADITILCWAVRSLNGGNLDVTSPAHRHVLSMARTALQQHLKTVLAESQFYIHNLRYATDFVWAKFVFCFLLLLELSDLSLEDADSQTLKEDLMAQGNALFQELAIAGGIITGETCSRVVQDYLEILRSGIESFSHSHRPSNFPAFTSPEQRLRESLVPDRIALEWGFPHFCLQTR